MDRKVFLRKVVPAGLAGLLVNQVWGKNDPIVVPERKKIPNYLSAGDTIAITCPAGPMTLKEIEDCIKTLTSWGFKIKLGNTVGNHWQRFGGTDEERAADVQAMLEDSDVKAVLFGRGGYGVMRMMDKVNWDVLGTNPKWLVGFSDITALHCHIQSLFGIATIHSDMASGFNGEEDNASRSLRQALTGEKISYQFEGCSFNRCGIACGELVGGNLSMIYAMQASPGELKTKGKILMIEDVGEYKYTIDRMLLNLKRSGKLDHLAALVVGGFTLNREEAEPGFTMLFEELVLEKVKEYNYPVAFQFPAGHQRLNLAFKLGLPYELCVGIDGCSITEATIV